MNELPLEDRVVVIVGGTTGLGLSAAKACIAAGGKVVCCGRSLKSVESAQQVLGQSALVLSADATESDCADRLIAVAINSFHGFDALYHVAGGSGRKFGDGPLHELTDEGIELTQRLNLTSLLYSNRAAVRSFLAREVPGTILNMSSVLAFSPSPQFFATHSYAATKAAVIGFSKSCAAYYAPMNIRFNVVAPALMETPMSTRAVADNAIQAFIKNKQPLDGGRVGATEDLDSAVVYFLSNQSRFVTGQVLAVDGGWCVSQGEMK